MSKEEIEQLFDEYGKTEVIIDKKDMDKICDKFKELQEKVETEHKAYMVTIQELTETATRIDKAVEYIENNLQSFLYSIEYKTLLNILKGSDK